MVDYYERSLIIHEQLHGKIGIYTKIPVLSKQDLATAYTPGVARPCEIIASDPSRARDLTIKRNTVAVVSDGSAVLGLGNIGALASLPVMEGKALLFKEFANIDAWPICLATQDVDEIVLTVRRIAPVFGGINLEDISAPRCFEVERRLQNLGIPVFHDDQHGTAVVVLAAMINSARLLKRDMSKLKILVNGAGAAGVAVSLLLKKYSEQAENPVFGLDDLIMCDSKGVIHSGREDIAPYKKELLKIFNHAGLKGNMKEAIEGCDVFIGVSKGNLLDAGDVRRMTPSPIIFAMANPVPEIMPDEALAAGAAVVGTGRSDFPNQINNVLAFPGIFRGALDARAERIDDNAKIAAAEALADSVNSLAADRILPDPLDRRVPPRVAGAVRRSLGGE